MKLKPKRAVKPEGANGKKQSSNVARVVAFNGVEGSTQKKFSINSIPLPLAVILFNHIPVPAKTSAPFDYGNVRKQFASHPSAPGFCFSSLGAVSVQIS